MAKPHCNFVVHGFPCAAMEANGKTPRDWDWGVYTAPLPGMEDHLRLAARRQQEGEEGTSADLPPACLRPPQHAHTPCPQVRLMMWAYPFLGWQRPRGVLCGAVKRIVACMAASAGFPRGYVLLEGFH